MSASIPIVNQQIEDCDKNASGLGTWKGANGIKAILGYVVGLIGSRGCYRADNVSVLGTLSGNDTGLAIVGGSGIYGYDTNAHNPANIHDVVANGGGTWKFLGSLNYGPFLQAVGDGSTLVFNLNHGLNTSFPTVLIYATAQGFPYSLVAAQSIQVTSANYVKVTFESAPALDALTIIIKP